MAWRRRYGWSSHAEHFHFDAARARFVIEEQRRSDTGHRRSRATAGVEPAAYLAALAEVRREVRRRSADDWETGQLIRLYAEATALEGQHPVPQWPSRYAVDEDEHEATQSEYELARQWTALNQELPRLIVKVCELMIRRYHPDAPESIVACLTDDGPGVTGRLNTLTDSLRLPDGREMLSVWLASFDRPDYWQEDRFGDELMDKGPHAVSAFLDACAALARAILADAGCVATARTVGVVSTPPNDGSYH